MKTVFFVIEKETNNMLGAYPSYDIAEFESTANILSNPFNPIPKGVVIRRKDDVPDPIFDHLMSLNRKEVVMN